LEVLLPAKGYRREDYLKAIYLLSEEAKSIRVKDIAEFLRVKPASVVEYLERLAAEGLIVYRKGEGAIELTSKGYREARKVAEKYEAIYRFLTTILGIPSDRAKREACYAEHGFSEETARRIRELSQLISICVEKCPDLKKFSRWERR